MAEIADTGELNPRDKLQTLKIPNPNVMATLVYVRETVIHAKKKQWHSTVNNNNKALTYCVFYFSIMIMLLCGKYILFYAFNHTTYY